MGDGSRFLINMAMQKEHRPRIVTRLVVGLTIVGLVQGISVVWAEVDGTRHLRLRRLAERAADATDTMGALAVSKQVWGKKEGQEEYTLLASYERKSPVHRGRPWAETGYVELKISSVPIGVTGGFAVLGQGNPHQLPNKFRGGLADVFLTWAPTVQRYVITHVDAYLPGATRSPTRLRFHTVWGRRSDEEVFVLIDSFRFQAPRHLGREWKEAGFFDIRIDSVGLYEGGSFNVLGQTNAGKLGRAYENGSASVFLQWSGAQDPYVVTHVDGWKSGEVGRPRRFQFRTVWGWKSPTGTHVLLDSYQHRGHIYKEVARRWRRQGYVELQIRSARLNINGALQVFRRIVLTIGQKHRDKPVEVDLKWSQASRRYEPLHARIWTQEGKPPRDLWFTLVTTESERTVSRRWPPARILQAAFRGSWRWWWLNYRANLRRGAIVWIPWHVAGSTLSLSPLTLRLYNFSPRASETPTYGVYQWLGLSTWRELGVVVGDQWIPARELSQSLAQLREDQRITFEEQLKPWIARHWGWGKRHPDRFRDVYEIATLAALEGLLHDWALPDVQDAVRRVMTRVSYARRLLLLSELQGVVEGEEPFDIEASRFLRSWEPSPDEVALSRIVRVQVGAQLASLLDREELAALVEVYDLVPEIYGWSELPAIPQMRVTTLEARAIKRIRAALAAGQLTREELGALVGPPSESTDAEEITIRPARSPSGALDLAL